jgi:IS5 family transposase
MSASLHKSVNNRINYYSHALLEWPAISVLLKRGLKSSGLGPRGYDPVVLFKYLLIGKWHGLPDPTLEQNLRVRLDFMLFARLDLHAPVPDETTHCRFRGRCNGGCLQ